MRQTVTIARLGHLGDGIADGPVFAPRALPGEVVSGVLDGDQLTDMRIDTPAPERVRPYCRHYSSCGGCQLAHASDGFVADWKRGVIVAALTAQGIEADVAPTLTSPMRSRRRASVSVRRGKKGAMIGFHARASDQIVPIEDCPVMHPDIQAALPGLTELARLGGSRKAELSVAITQSDAGLDILVRGGKPLDGPLRADLASLVHAQNYARLTWADDGMDEVIATNHAPVQTMGRADVTPPPGAFLQATQHGQDVLVQRVLEITKGAQSVVDLFAGCGTFALPLAQSSAVQAFEGDAAMIAALDHGWRHAKGLRNVQARVRDLFRDPLRADELNAFDAAVIDPPRAGAAAQVAQIAQSDLGCLAYVSCNPVTFARDCAALIKVGFQLSHVQPVDQFRGAAHVELVAQLQRS
jgi:23S rRNA (uracil1939-C5)-methyltransferase